MRTEELVQIFGHNLKRLLREKKLNQKMLAEKLGLSQMQISKWMHGTSKPTLDSLAAVCRVLGVEPEELFRNTDRMAEKLEIFTQDEMALFQKFQQFQKSFTNAS
jgi:transcriptional regulator with XRE-family HTH domain